MTRSLVGFESTGPSRNRRDRCARKNADWYAVTYYLDAGTWRERIETRVDGYYCNTHAEERLKELRMES